MQPQAPLFTQMDGHPTAKSQCHITRHCPNVTSHGTVNHSVCFVDPTSGVRTQHIESYWGRAKLNVMRMKGCHAHQLSSYLDEFMWRERHGKMSKDALDNIFRDIAVQYPECNSYVFSTFFLLCSMLASIA